MSGIEDGQFDRAVGVAIDESGNVFVTDDRTPRIQKFGYSTPVQPTTWGRIKAKYGN